MVELDEFQKLEQALIDAGRAIEYPATPNLAARVRTDLNGECARADRPVRRLRPALVVVLAILAAIALLLIIPETREAIAQLLGSAHHPPHRNDAHATATSRPHHGPHPRRASCLSSNAVRQGWRKRSKKRASRFCCRPMSNHHASSFKIRSLARAANRSKWSWCLAIRIDHASCCIKRHASSMGK